jgi:quercetin dioxygenase-like cupin family protein
MTQFYPSYVAETAFQPSRFNPVVLAESERTKVILACFEPGQFIPVHHPRVDLTLVVLDGEGTMVAGK